LDDVLGWIQSVSKVLIEAWSRYLHAWQAWLMCLKVVSGGWMTFICAIS